MKKIVLVFGLISGAISAALMAMQMTRCYNDPNYEGSMVIGYASMILALSLIFVAVKTFRDKHNNGTISFGKAFMLGLYVSLITATMYVAVWAIMYNFFMPDFMEKYNVHMIEGVQKAGGTAAEISGKLAEIEKSTEMYKNPLFFTLMTYAEILPVGLLISLISALVMMRKVKKDDGVSGTAGTS